MKLSQHTDYALRLLIYLAVREHAGAAEPATVERVAAAYGLSAHHLAKIAQEMVRHGWLESSRGRGGGLGLACPPARINLGEVVRKMEKTTALVECMEAGSTCVIEPVCALKKVLADAQRAFFDVLDRHTLADVTAHPRRFVPLLIGGGGPSPAG